jgi:hypothetical protein
MSVNKPAPHRDQYDSVVKLVEKISIAGTINRQQQTRINQCEKKSTDKLDLMALSRLSDLIHKGAVKPVE